MCKQFQFYGPVYKPVQTYTHEESCMNWKKNQHKEATDNDSILAMDVQAVLITPRLLVQVPTLL